MNDEFSACREGPGRIVTLAPTAERLMESSDESVLIARAKAGEIAAFEQALSPHLPMLGAYSRAICGDFHRAQDVVQETALIAWRNLQHLFPQVDFGSWLKGIARRQALAARREGGRLLPAIEAALEDAYEDPSRTPESIADALRSCVDKLEKHARGLVTGHYFDGKPLAALAEEFGMNVNTIKTVLHRARQVLQICVGRAR
jgi:RNA polymerase sigma-70 factor (ECF subfamily)